MKVCCIGDYRNGSGYANALIEYMMALDSVDIDVVCRNIQMTNKIGSVPDNIKRFENNHLNNVDVNFQYNLPSEFAYKQGVLNVGGFAYETTGFPNSNWKQHLDMMDEVIVPCLFQQEAQYNKAKVVPHALNTEKFTKDTEVYDLGCNKNTLKFYTICEFNRRKNIIALVVSYLSAFDASDDVVLVIKTSAGSNEKVKEMVNDVKAGLKRFTNALRYPRIILIASYLTDAQIDALHNNCDIFVSTSYGEGFCIPAAEAIGWGNQLIIPRATAFNDFYNLDNTSIGIEGQWINCFGSTDSIPNLYTSDEKWFSINTADFTNKLKIAQNNWYKITNRDELKNDRYSIVKRNFSREVIGNKLKDIFNNAIN